MNRRTFIALVAALLFSVEPSLALTPNTWIAGDSIGVGLAMVTGLPSVAHQSTSIAGANVIVAQFARIPAGSKVYLSLGLNDAVGTAHPFDKNIQKIIDSAKAKNFDLVWIGPPSVKLSYAKNINGVNATIVVHSGIKFVNIAVVSTSMPRSGVHFTSEGYKELWRYIRSVA